MNLVGLKQRSSRSGTSTPLVLEERRWLDLTSADIAAWKRLGQQPLEPNPFQQPEFLLPKVRHLDPDPDRVRVLVVRDRSSDEWLMAGTFLAMTPSLKRPIPRLRAYSWRHAFLDQPLIARQASEAVVRTWLQALPTLPHWHGVRFRNLDRNSLLGRRQLEASAAGTLCLGYDRVWERAAIDFSQTPADLLETCSKSRRKSLRRALGRLQAGGTVSFRLCRPAPDDPRPLREFLRLEDAGWKGACGSSLLSLPSDTRFIEDVTRLMSATGQVVFGELRVGSHVIASTYNFVSAGTLFAFKIGWDPAWAEGSPGLWSELMLFERVRDELPEIRWMDSCSAPGSHIDSVWPQRRLMADTFVTWTYVGRMLAAARGNLHLWRMLLSQPSAEWPEELLDRHCDICFTG